MKREMKWVEKALSDGREGMPLFSCVFSISGTGHVRKMDGNRRMILEIRDSAEKSRLRYIRFQR